MLRLSHIAPQFYGFVEGHDIAAGTTDVIVMVKVVLQASPGKGWRAELVASAITALSQADASSYPLHKKDHAL